MLVYDWIFEMLLEYLLNWIKYLPNVFRREQVNSISENSKVNLLIHYMIRNTNYEFHFRK